MSQRLNPKKGFLSGIGKNVLLVGFVSLFTDLSSQMVFPLIPLFMTSVLAAPAFAVGLVEGAAESIAALLKVVAGFWSDRVKKRKPFIFWGYTFSGFTKPLFAFVPSWPYILLIRAIERIGKGVRNAPRDALVAESCDKEVVGKAFGIQRTMDGLGSVLGALLGALFMTILVGDTADVYRKIFLISFIPAILATFAILLLKEPKAAQEEGTKKISIKGSWKELPANLKLFTVVSSIFAFGHFGYAFLLLRAKNIGLSDRRAILLYAGFYLVYTIVSTPLGALSDKIGRKTILLIGYFLFAVTSFGLIYATSLQGIIIAFAVYGVFFAIIDGGQKAFVVDLCPKHLKATALGAFYTSIGIFALPGGFVAGMLWEKINPQATFVFGGVLALLAFAVLLFINPKNREVTPAG